MQPSATVTFVAGHECAVATPTSQIGCSNDTLDSVTSVNNVPPTLHQSQPSSQLHNQNSQLLLSAPQYYEERPDRLVHQSLQHKCNNWTFPQSIQPHVSAPIHRQGAQLHPTSAVMQHNLADPQYCAHYPKLFPTPWHTRMGTVPRLRALEVEQQCSTSAPRLPHGNFSQALHAADVGQCQQSPYQRQSHFLQRRSLGSFHQAHDFVINDSVFVDNSGNSDSFMASFLKETILGAEFDSSDPNMPLRCHRGTRLKIIKRCQDFILNREGRPKLRWVVGSAGVGKSAIMQSVAHDESNVLSEIILGATIFFSVNGRQDGTKAITTIAYQLAVKLHSYRLFMQREIVRDPSLLRKSLSRQFNKFIVEPFIHQRILDCSSRLLIIIDGLDECSDRSRQQELLSLVLCFCITYPSSPIVWLIASRPEPHITSFFSDPNIIFAYEKEEILVDSEEACKDVKRYLRDEFREVQMASIMLRELSRWPSKDDFLKIANASGGLFAYASTVVRYISDPDYGDPVALLDDVLEIIETGTKENIWGRNHPMAHLDALYTHIMSKIPANVMADTRKLLLLEFQSGYHRFNFHFSCNLLGMTQHAAYGATHYIRSIASVPGPIEATEDSLEFFHKSIFDYLRDFDRSGFFLDTRSECDQLFSRCTLRILEEAPNGVYIDETTQFYSGLKGAELKSGLDLGAKENISISWPAIDGDNHGLRLLMFDVAIGQAMYRFQRGEEAFQSLLCIRALTTCFAELPEAFPFDAVREFVFDESKYHELFEHGILKRVPLATFHYDEIMINRPVRLRFRGPGVEYSNPWNVACQHTRKGTWDGHTQDWSTLFRHTERYNPRYECNHCFERFINHFKTQQPGQFVTVLTLTPRSRLVELRFVGPDDGASVWIYHFFAGEDDKYYYYEEKNEED